MRRALLIACLLAGCGGQQDEASAPPMVRTVTAPRAAQPVGDRVQARIATGTLDVCSIVAAAGVLWVASNEKTSLVQVDPARNRVAGRVRVPGHPCGMAVHDGLLWVQLGLEGLLVAIDPQSGRIVRRIRTEETCEAGFAFGAGRLYLIDSLSPPVLSERDPATGATLAELPLPSDVRSGGAGPCALAVAGGSIWIGTVGKVLRVDPRRLRVVASVDGGFDPWWLAAVVGDDVWFGRGHQGELHRLDARTGRLEAAYDFGGGALVADGGHVWTTSSSLVGDRDGSDPVLTLIDRRSDRVTARWRVGRRATRWLREEANPRSFALGGLALADGSLWVGQNVEHRLYRIAP
jgi:sugar lactone lactonase YvrE